VKLPGPLGEADVDVLSVLGNTTFVDQVVLDGNVLANKLSNNIVQFQRLVKAAADPQNGYLARVVVGSRDGLTPSIINQILSICDNGKCLDLVDSLGTSIR
jgi:hypothetical protein